MLLMYNNGSGGWIEMNDHSVNKCDGDDCNYRSWCDQDLRESFMMLDLKAGDYALWLQPFGQSGGDYVVEMHCESDGSWNDTVSDGFKWDDSDCDAVINGSCVVHASITCGETIAGNLEFHQILALNFTNNVEQDVFVTNCGSNFVCFLGFHQCALYIDRLEAFTAFFPTAKLHSFRR